MSLSKSFANSKQLVFEISLGVDRSNGPSKNFENGADILVLSGLRASVDIDVSGYMYGAHYFTMSAKIWGMSEKNMEAATSLVLDTLNKRQNSISVFAVDGDIKTLVYSGNIITSFANYSTMPNVMFEIEAGSLYNEKLRARPATSYAGEIDVATVFEQYAASLGLALENADVKVKLRDIALTGSWPEQAQKLAEMAGINMMFDRGSLCIWPKGKERLASQTVVISGRSGMVGYPIFMDAGVNVTILHNHNVQVGTNVFVESDYPRANGLWYVLSIRHMLDSNLPNGRWFSALTCLPQPYVAIK